MKNKIILFFLLLGLSSVAQENEKIDFVILKYNVYNEAYSNVEISIFETNSKKKIFRLEAKYYNYTKKQKKKIKISEEEFIKLKEVILKIENKDLISNFSSGLDGSLTELEYGSGINSIRFQLWGIHKNQRDTSLKHFITAVQLLLELSDVKIESYN